MLDDIVIQNKLKNKFDKLGINEIKREQLTSELNLLSNLLIDIYLDKNDNKTVNK